MTKVHLIITAAGTTLGLVLSALAIGFFLAICFAALEGSRSKYLALIGTVVVTLLRGLPEILVVLFIYFGISKVMILLADGITLNLGITQVFLRLTVNNFDTSSLWSAVIALSLLYAAYASQTLQSSLKAIGQGQWESAQALGMRSSAIFFSFILPQIWRHALPGLGNQWLVLLKDSALVSLISVNDLMLQTKSIVNFTHQPFTWYLVAAGMYLTITLFSQAILVVLERRASYFEQEGS